MSHFRVTKVLLEAEEQSHRPSFNVITISSETEEINVNDRATGYETGEVLRMRKKKKKRKIVSS